MLGFEFREGKGKGREGRGDWEMGNGIAVLSNRRKERGDGVVEEGWMFYGGSRMVGVSVMQGWIEL